MTESWDSKGQSLVGLLLVGRISDRSAAFLAVTIGDPKNDALRVIDEGIP
jgi:hypothetical protein